MHVPVWTPALKCYDVGCPEHKRIEREKHQREQVWEVDVNETGMVKFYVMYTIQV